MEVKREPVQALGRSSVVEEEAPQEPEPEPSNPIGTLEEVGEARIARRPPAVRGGGAEPKLCTTGALLILDLDNDQGEDALNLLRNHMKRFPGKHGIRFVQRFPPLSRRHGRLTPFPPLPHPSRAQPGGGVHESLHEQAGHPGLCGAAEVPLQGRRQRGRRVRHHSGGPPPFYFPPRVVRAS